MDSFNRRFTPLNFLPGKIIYFICYFLFTCHVLGVQSYKPKLRDPVLESWRWQPFNELYGKGVECLAESNDGSMWFGVKDGVIKYNGIKWHHFTGDSGIVGAPVKTICTAKDGSIYVGSNEGVTRYYRNKWEKIYPKDDFPATSINHIIETDDGTVLIAAEAGLIIIDKQETYLFTWNEYANDLNTNNANIKVFIVPDIVLLQNGQFHVYYILEDSYSNIWLSINYRDEDCHLIKYTLSIHKNNPVSSKFWYSFHQATGVSFGSKSRMFEDKYKTIWILSDKSDFGYYRYNPRSSSFYYMQLSNILGGSDSNVSFIQTDDGSIWIGAHTVLYIYHKNRWKMYTPADMPISKTSRNLVFKKSDGSIWLAGERGRVSRFDYSQERLSTYFDLNFQDESENGDTWFIEKDGSVVVKRKKRWYQYNQNDGLMDAPSRLLISKSGDIFVAGSHQHLAAIAHFRGRSWDLKIYPNLSWNIDCRSVFESSSGDIYFGANIDTWHAPNAVGGIIQYTKTPDGIWNTKHILEPLYTFGFAEGYDHKIRIASGKRLFILDKDSVNDMTNHFQMSLGEIDCIKNDQDNSLWYGSRNYGVFYYSHGSLINYNADNGLVDNSIISILPLNKNNVWVATSEDISHFDGSGWTTDIFPKSLVMDWDAGSIHSSGDSSLWFNYAPRKWKRRAIPGANLNPNEIDKFMTIRIQPDKGFPDTKVTTYKEKVASDASTTIEWIGDDIWGRTPQNKLQYSYRIYPKNKKDVQWKPFTSETHHTFSDLDKGRKYIFEVRARDLDMNVDPSPALITFRILPPFYMHPAFIIFVFIGIILLGYQSIKIWQRDRSLKIINKELIHQKQEIEKAQNRVLESYSKMRETSTILANTSSNVKDNTNQINVSMQKVTQGASEQNEHVEKTREFLNDLSNTVSSASYDAERSLKITEKTVHAITESMEGMHKTLDTMNVIEKSVESTWEIIQGLGEHSSQIDDIIEIINDIASRVNVLSLNAAIEATKAGKYGVGFMVVAQEIRQLARNVGDSTQAIADSVSALQYEIKCVQKVIQDSQKRVKSSAKLTNKGRKILDQIQHSVTDEQNRVGKITIRILEMQDYSVQVENALEGVAEISQKNSRAVQEVEGQTNAVGKYIEQLASMAQSIKETVSANDEVN